MKRRIDLIYSIGLLGDYRSDLQLEAKGLTKTINTTKRKLKVIEDKITSNGGTLWKMKR